MSRKRELAVVAGIARGEKRVALGRLLRDLTFAGLAAKGSVEQWWGACEEYHRNEFHESDSPGPGVPPLAIPFSQPRLDMLTSQVCAVLGKQDPYMLADEITGDDTVETAQESLVHKFWQKAGFEAKLRKGSAICTDTNLVWFRFAFERTQDLPFNGMIIDVIHPKDIVIYPAGVEGISGARLTGHRFYRRYRDVVSLQNHGVYFEDAAVVGGQTPMDHDETGEIRNSGADPTATGPDRNDRMVELWQVIFKFAENEEDDEKWYAATITAETGALLCCSEYPYSRPWYFDAGYIVENNDAYYPGVSVGRHLSALQDATNKVSSMLYGGGMMGASPPVFGPELSEKDFRYGPGQYIPSDRPATSFFSPSVRFNGAPLQSQYEVFQQIGDQTARVSANTMGALQARDTTATENSIIASGVSVGLEEYIANFSAHLGDAAAFTVELLTHHFNDWHREAELLKITPEVLLAPCLWEPNGKTPGNTPGAKLAAAQKIVELFTACAGMPMGAPNPTGIDIYELTKVILVNSGLGGADNIQVPKERLAPAAAPGGAAGPVPGVGPGGLAVPPMGTGVAGPATMGPSVGSQGAMGQSMGAQENPAILQALLALAAGHAGGSQ